MTDIVTPAKRSQMMAGIKAKNTKPEIFIRKMLHTRGYRFRLHRKDLPGKPDIVLPKYRAAIFVQGCYWHGHNNCHLFRLPKSRSDFWNEKISGNIKRDTIKLNTLQKMDWRVLWIWECVIKGKKRKTEDDLAKSVTDFLNDKSISFKELRG